MKKVWTACVNCDYQNDCEVGAQRIKGLAKDSPVVNDIGCFDCVVYNKQKGTTQLKLF